MRAVPRWGVGVVAVLVLVGMKLMVVCGAAVPQAPAAVAAAPPARRGFFSGMSRGAKAALGMGVKAAAVVGAVHLASRNPYGAAMVANTLTGRPPLAGLGYGAGMYGAGYGAGMPPLGGYGAGMPALGGYGAGTYQPALGAGYGQASYGNYPGAPVGSALGMQQPGFGQYSSYNYAQSAGPYSPPPFNPYAGGYGGWRGCHPHRPHSMFVDLNAVQRFRFGGMRHRLLGRLHCLCESDEMRLQRQMSQMNPAMIY